MLSYELLKVCEILKEQNDESIETEEIEETVIDADVIEDPIPYSVPTEVLSGLKTTANDAMRRYGEQNSDLAYSFYKRSTDVDLVSDDLNKQRDALIKEVKAKYDFNQISERTASKMMDYINNFYGVNKNDLEESQNVKTLVK